jgi:hypothetical protein
VSSFELDGRRLPWGYVMALFFSVELIEMTVHRLSNSGYLEPHIVQPQHEIARCTSP